MEFHLDVVTLQEEREGKLRKNSREKSEKYAMTYSFNNEIIWITSIYISYLQVLLAKIVYVHLKEVNDCGFRL